MSLHFSFVWIHKAFLTQQVVSSAKNSPANIETDQEILETTRMTVSNHFWRPGIPTTKPTWEGDRSYLYKKPLPERAKNPTYLLESPWNQWVFLAVENLFTLQRGFNTFTTRPPFLFSNKTVTYWGCWWTIYPQNHRFCSSSFNLRVFSPNQNPQAILGGF